METTKKTLRELADSFHKAELLKDLEKFLQECKSVAENGHYSNCIPYKYNDHFLRTQFLDELLKHGLILDLVNNTVTWE